MYEVTPPVPSPWLAMGVDTCYGHRHRRKVGSSMFTRIVLVGLLAICIGYVPLPAVGALPTVVEVDADVQESILVSGTIDVESDGSVGGYRLEHESELPPSVVARIAAAVPTWRFRPTIIDGEGVAVRARMHLRLVAKPINASAKEIRLSSASFPHNAATGETLEIGHVSLTDLIRALSRLRADGIVYVSMKVDRDGRVEDAVVRQVTLYARTTRSRMALVRDEYTRSALITVQRMRFLPISAGESRHAPYWTGILPIELCMDESPCYTRKPWQWGGYFPGPLNRAPWDIDHPTGATDPRGDAIPSGRFQLANGELILITPLNGG